MCRLWPLVNDKELVMLPTQADIDALIGFLPQLYPNGVPIEAYTFKEPHPWPIYAKVVDDFYEEARKDCWLDIDYRSTADRLLSEPGAIEQASLAQLQSLVTYYVRGERFCDGHWGAMIAKGYVQRLLTRLAQLRAAM